MVISGSALRRIAGSGIKRKRGNRRIPILRMKRLFQKVISRKTRIPATHGLQIIFRSSNTSKRNSRNSRLSFSTNRQRETSSTNTETQGNVWSFSITMERWFNISPFHYRPAPAETSSTFSGNFVVRIETKYSLLADEMQTLLKTGWVSCPSISSPSMVQG